MNCAEGYIRVIQNALCVYSKSGIIGNLKSHTAGLSNYYMPAFRIKLTVYLGQFLCFRTYILCGLLPMNPDGGRLRVVVAFFLGLLIHSKYT